MSNVRIFNDKQVRTLISQEIVTNDLTVDNITVDNITVDNITINNSLILTGVVYIDASQTLTNKDLTSGTNTLPLSRTLRITETATQSINSAVDVAVTFGSSTASTPTVGTLAGNVVTFNGSYRLLVNAVYNAGNAIATSSQTLIIRHRLNGSNITNGSMFTSAAGIGDINILSISFPLDVVNGDTFDVRADASVSSVRFASGVPNFPCKSVLFTQL